MRRATCLVLFALTFGARAEAQVDPREVADSVHAERGYPDRLVIRSDSGGAFPFPPSGGGEGDGADGAARRRPEGERTDGVEGRLQGRDETVDANAPGASFDLGGLGEWVARLFSELTRILLLGVVVGLGAFLVYLIARYVRPSAAAPVGPAPEPGELAPDDYALPEDPGDPDVLAAAGRFDEAIVALLVRALKHVGWEPGSQRGLTAREVLRSLRDARQGPLREIVRGAERVRFAGDAADRETYGQLRRWYDALLGTRSTAAEAS